MKYYQSDQLQKIIDWDNIMKIPRYAGGHDQQMTGLFKDALVIAHFNEGGFQGMVATCVVLADGKYVIYNDFYGSCSGCDAWKDSTDEDVYNMCINLSNSSYIFESIDDVVSFLKIDKKDGYSWGNIGKDLLKEILKNQQAIREIRSIILLIKIYIPMKDQYIKYLESLNIEGITSIIPYLISGDISFKDIEFFVSFQDNKIISYSNFKRDIKIQNLLA